MIAAPTAWMSVGDDRGGAAFLALLAAVAILVPLLNLAVPASSPLHLSTYVLTLIGKYLCYMMLALAVDLIWGYAASSASATPRSSPWAATPWGCI